MTELFYRVERDENGCRHCDHGASWTVVWGRGDDAVQISTSFFDMDQAEDLCQFMNEAFRHGQQRPDAEAVAAVPSLAGQKALVLYFATDQARDEFAATVQAEMGCVRTVQI